MADRTPRQVAGEALADLSALVRGGGPPGAAPDTLAGAAADALVAMLGDEPLTIDVTARGLVSGGEGLWSDDLLSRRVAGALQAQGLRTVSVDPGCDPRAVRALVVLLTRDWTQQADDAFERLVEQRSLPGVHFDFAPAPGAMPRGGPAPGELLTIVRGDAAGEHATLGPLLARLAAAREVPADAMSLVQGADISARAALSRELDALHHGVDAEHDEIGRLAYETVRLDPSGLQATDTFRLVLDHFLREVGAGAPREAQDLLRRLVALGSGHADPDWPHVDLLGAELGAVVGPPLLQRLDGLGEVPDTPEWRELFFNLVPLVPEERLPDFVRSAGSVGGRGLRQALADGLMLRFKDPELLLGWLKEARGVPAVVLLLALSRAESPAHLEKLLARVASPDEEVREAALVAVRHYRTPRTLEVVRAALDDVAAPVRVEALRYLCVYRDADTAPLILERLRDAKPAETDDGELRALAIGLALIARQEAVLPLTHLAQDTAEKHPAVARAAIAGLGSLGEGGRAALAGLTRSGGTVAILVKNELGGVQ